MAITSSISDLDRITRRSPLASDPDVRAILSFATRDVHSLVEAASPDALGAVRIVASALCRLRGSANAESRLDCLFECCTFFFYSGNSADVVSVGRRALSLARASGRVSDERRFLTVVGIALNEIGDPGQSISYLIKAIEVADAHDVSSKYLAWVNLGAIFLDSGLYRESIACSRTALSLSDSCQHASLGGGASAFTNIAQALLNLGEPEEALLFAVKAVENIDAPRDAKSAQSAAIRRFTQLMVFLLLGRNGELKHQKSALGDLARDFPLPKILMLSKLAASISDVYSGDVSKGLNSLENLLDQARAHRSPLVPDCLSSLSRCYKEAGRPEEALHAIEMLLEYLGGLRVDTAIIQLRAIGTVVPVNSVGLVRNSREHQRSEEELKNIVLTRELSRSRQEMLERMAVAADIREDISGEHGYRVGRLAALLAKEIGWDREACNALDMAARLHDIGKIGIPEKILLDEKTLKQAEKHFIASHTLVGAEILAKSEIPQVRIAEEIARCHHEWWDGTGYPKGLKGASIPKVARIVALADVFDAMTHGRPYARAIPIERALDEIATLRGRQFDPELTDHFLGLVRRLAADNEDLDAYLGRAARNSPFLKARARIKEMLAQGHDSIGLSAVPPPPGTPLN